MKKYNVIIIGMGPAGLFATKTILERSKDATVLVLEQGMDTVYRKCPADTGTCQLCEHCAVVSGAGGAGMFSDGKLVLDLNFGGDSKNIERLSTNQKETICNYIKETLKEYDGMSEFKDMKDPDEIENVQRRFYERNFSIMFYPVLHMGTRNLTSITKNFVNALTCQYSNRLTILYGKEVKTIEKKSDGYILQDKNGQIFGLIIRMCGIENCFKAT